MTNQGSGTIGQQLLRLFPHVAGTVALLAVFCIFLPLRVGWTPRTAG